MAIRDDELETEIKGILESLDSTSQLYGKLLNGQGADSFWHYGIGLSDTQIFDTGRGWQPFERHYVDAKFVLGIDDLAYPPDKTSKRLIHALRCFKDWDYGLLGWNCEHLGRLAATNQPISYEVNRQPWPIPQLNHNGWHPTAEGDLRDHLLRHAPELV